ncbi:MAG: hypothetical protein UU76_C0006G0010 [Parcubacteria group bacterium GW2011_GWC1_41_7]|nr:MAG: hypothetical protein UU76_C0006G0010 [Parcubacteria group bacterium GW2011_GWC1_41_7]
MAKKIVFIIMVLVFLVWGAGKVFSSLKNNVSSSKKSETPQAMQKTDPERVIIQTEDGVDIVGDWYSVEGGKQVGILLHAMPENRKSFSDFARALNQQGLSALAIDLRGHGESTNSLQGSLNYKKFSENNHQQSIFDVQAASIFLEGKGYAKDMQFLVGASVGANFAMKYASENKAVKAVVALSPGLNYRGIETETLPYDNVAQKMFLVAAQDDVYAVQTVQVLQKKNETFTIKIYTSGGHGTALLKNQPDLTILILNFLKDKLI